MRAPILAASLLSLSLAACQTASAESYMKPGLDTSRLTRIAVVDGNNPAFSPTVRQALVDDFQIEFFRKGWPVIERDNVDLAIEEIDFQNSEFASAAERKRLGEILNVQGLVIVNIASAGSEMTVNAKMIDPQSGELLWTGSGTGKIRSGLQTLSGAVLGAAAGAAVGDSDGAAIGAVVGGAAGYSLTASEMENARELVREIGLSIPLR